VAIVTEREKCFIQQFCQFLRSYSINTVYFSLRYSITAVIIIQYTGYAFDSPQVYMPVYHQCRALMFVKRSIYKTLTTKIGFLCTLNNFSLPEIYIQRCVKNDDVQT
jgi:hypothetical protein